MQGIIIAGGFGTRFRPLTYTRPKPLMPILNRPLLEYQVALLKAHGVTEIVFATNYMAEAIEEHFGDGSRFGVKMRYAQEEQPLGTAGAIRNAAKSLWRQESVAVFNGDIVTDFNLGAIIALHRRRGARATIALKAVPSPNPYGVIDLDNDGRVLAWREPTEEQKKALAANPNVEQTGWDYINAGFYVLEPEVIESIPEGRAVSIEREIYPRMIAQGEGLYGAPAEGYWVDVAGPAHYWKVTNDLLRGRVNVSLPGAPYSEGLWCMARAQVRCTLDSGAVAHVGEGAVLEEGVRLRGTVVIGAGCHVERGCVLEDCVLLEGVRVGECAILTRVICDRNVFIDAGSRIVEAVIAAGSRIERESRLGTSW
ncbi:MAG: NDP-sugar synthase [Armatimonadota bacterium]|nr:NDP-sugar synthase [Armatimonadota bacterium]